MPKRKAGKSKGMKAGALKKGGGAKLGRAGAKLGPAAGAMPAPPRGSSAPLGAAGTKLGDNRSRARDKRLQNAQL
jgi:hypothetical protein